MQFLSGIIFIIITFPTLPIKFLVSRGIFDKYLKQSEWFVDPINNTGDIIINIYIIIWLIILTLLVYWIMRAIALGVYKFIKKRNSKG